jgi:hypothetical protein
LWNQNHQFGVEKITGEVIQNVEGLVEFTRRKKLFGKWSLAKPAQR